MSHPRLTFADGLLIPIIVSFAPPDHPPQPVTLMDATGKVLSVVTAAEFKRRAASDPARCRFHGRTNCMGCLFTLGPRDPTAPRPRTRRVA